MMLSYLMSPSKWKKLLDTKIVYEKNTKSKQILIENYLKHKQSFKITIVFPLYIGIDLPIFFLITTIYGSPHKRTNFFMGRLDSCFREALLYLLKCKLYELANCYLNLS